MTRDKNFKQLVRAHMRETGQNYTTARAELRPPATPTTRVGSPHPFSDAAASPQRPPASGSGHTSGTTERERAHAALMAVVVRYVRDGQLVQFPSRRKARAAVLLYLLPRFRPFTDYPEAEVNALLEPVVGDFAFWRRELVAFGYLTRKNGVYRVTERMPERTPTTAQEVPGWEELWLPLFISGRAR